MTVRHYQQRVLKPFKHSNGYLVVQLPRNDGEEGYKHCVVNRLVYSAFHRIPRDDEEVDHDDMVRDNNRPSNLVAMSVKRNRAKRRTRKGVDNHYAKLTEESVISIRASTKTHEEIAAEFNCSRSNVTAIRSRKTWRHLK